MMRYENNSNLPNEWTSSIHHHRQAQFILYEHISYCASCDTQESAASKPIKETGYYHGGNIAGDGTGNFPYHEKCVGIDVNRAATVELWNMLALDYS